MNARATLSESNTIRVHCDYADSHFVKQIPGRMWNQSLKVWDLPLTLQSVQALNRALPVCDVSSEVEAAVDEVGSWERRVRLAKSVPAMYWPEESISVEPYQHQMQAVQVGAVVLERSPAFAMWHEVGLGKSLSTLALYLMLGSLPRHPRVLVVCPGAVIGGWRKEIEKSFTDTLDFVPLTGPIKKRVTQIYERDTPTMYCTNWEALWRPDLLAALTGRIDVMICDEAHYLANASSKQSVAARKINALVRIALTGTPNDGTYRSIFGIYRWLDPTIFGVSKTAFNARYFHQTDIGGGVMIQHGIKEDMLPELLTKMHSIAHCVAKKDALDLPEAIPVDRYCDLEPSALRMFKSMKKEALAMLDDGSVSVGQNTLTRLLRMRQIAGGFIEGQQVSSAKLKLLKEVLTDTLVEQPKVIVFAAFRDEIDAILAQLTDMKIKHTLLDGRVPNGPRRDAVIEQFQNDFDTRVIVIQAGAGGVGINLQFCSCSILYSWDHSLIKWLQLMGRTDRIGQNNHPTYIRLIANNTTDQKILDSLDAKEDVSRFSTFQWKGLLT